MDLQKRFYELLETWVNNKAQIKLQWTELISKYNSRERHYHNMSHLTELFQYFDKYVGQLQYPNEVEYAIFYHDIIYNIWSKKNELNSAELAVDYLSAISLQGRISKKRVFDLIMVTQNHQPKDNPDEKWMIDFDLGVLGQSQTKYKIYTQQIREEYGSVPNFMYKRGRKKVLIHFLKKRRIYHTEPFYQLLETQARNNIKEELKIL